MSEVRAEALRLVKDWGARAATPLEVQNEASRLLELLGDDPAPSDADLESLLVQLDILDHQLITADDVPAMLELLQGDAPLEVREQRWNDYVDSIDLDSRARELSSDEFYAGARRYLEGRR